MISDRLKTEIAGVELSNPIIAASGTVGYGKELSALVELNQFGAISTKATTLRPRTGNPTPRIAETASGMLNSIGLENPGVDHFLKNELPWLAKQNTKIIVNIAGSTVDEFESLAEKLNETVVDLLELNISCPNVSKNGVNFGSLPETAFEVVAKVRKKTSKPIMAKLTPNTGSIVDVAKAVEAAGADVVSLVNTVLATRIDIETRRPVLKNNVGGLSGPAIFPIALRMIWQVKQAVKIPIVGCGGVACAENVIEMVLAGACAVQIGTVLFAQPDAAKTIADNLHSWLCSHKIENLSQLVGCVEAWN